MKSHSKVVREFHHLCGNIKDLTDEQCTVLDCETETESTTPDMRFVISIIPNDGPYKSGQFDFLFKVPKRYPSVPPRVKCLTHIYHPNIDDFGEICLSLFDDWSSGYNCLIHCIHGLLYLLENPNLDDPLSPYFCPEDAQDMDLFYRNVRTSLEGGVVDGFIQFKRNLVSNEVNKKDSKTAGSQIKC